MASPVTVNPLPSKPIVLTPLALKPTAPEPLRNQPVSWSSWNVKLGAVAEPSGNSEPAVT